MHRWIGVLTGAVGGGAINAKIGDDIATLVLFFLQALAGHDLPGDVAAAANRITSGAVVLITVVVTNLVWSKWGDKIAPPKGQS